MGEKDSLPQREGQGTDATASDALTSLPPRLKNISLHDDNTLQPETSSYHTRGPEWTRNAAEDILVLNRVEMGEAGATG